MRRDEALLGEPLAGTVHLAGPSLGQPTPMVLGGERSALPWRMTTSRRADPRTNRAKVGSRVSMSHPLGFLSCHWEPTVQPGAARATCSSSAEPRTSSGKRTVLREFVNRAGGADARIAVIPTASSLGPEIVEVYAALFHKLGAAEVYGVRPEDRAQASSPELMRGARPGDRHLHDRRQPAQAVHGDRGDAVRRRDRRGARSRRDHRGHVGRGQHPVLAHGRVRTGRLHPQAADDPGRGGARPGRELRDRPALRAAQPLRPAADDRVAEPAAARHGRRRGHRGRDHPHRRTPRCCASSAAGR